MAATYTPIATTTLGSANNSVTFSSISGSYTDLVLIYSGTTTNNNQNLAIQFNSDTATNYSETELYGNGTTAGSGRRSSLSQIFLNEQGGSSGQTTVVTNVMNYANTTTYKTALTRYGTAGGGPETNVGLWRSTSAITAIKIFLNGGTETFTAGSTFTLYGIANADVGAYATGGIITQDANYYYHAFGNSSYFTPTRNLTADILVVAGGGAAGPVGRGGGGAGGVIYQAGKSLSSGTSYTCTIGAGGAASNTIGTSANGSDSLFSTLQAFGGGGGGYTNGGSGNAGGSGGGAGGAAGGSFSGTGGSSTQTSNNGGTGYGTAGGNVATVSSHSGNSGGGGGAGSVGGSTNSTDSVLGSGGDGLSTWSSWGVATGLGQNVSGTYYFAGGGAGGTQYSGGAQALGGKGGGGNAALGGSTSAGSSGMPNTGGGGGAGDSGGVGYVGGSGGSGLIIVRYSK